MCDNVMKHLFTNGPFSCPNLLFLSLPPLPDHLPILAFSILACPARMTTILYRPKRLRQPLPYMLRRIASDGEDAASVQANAETSGHFSRAACWKDVAPLPPHCRRVSSMAAACSKEMLDSWSASINSFSQFP